MIQLFKHIKPTPRYNKLIFSTFVFKHSKQNNNQYIMKRIFLLTIVILLTYGSCKEISELTHFNINYKTNVTIPPSDFVGIPFDVITPYIPTNSDEIFGNNNTSSGLIEEIILTSMTINITSPSSQSFDFLKSIKIYIIANNLIEVKIAWYDDIPQTGLSSIIMETGNDDLKEFIKKDEFKLRFQTVIRQQISDSTEIEILSTFFVDALLLGI